MKQYRRARMTLAMGVLAVFLGCQSGGPSGGATVERETPEVSGTPARAGAVTVTYYYLPG